MKYNFSLRHSVLILNLIFQSFIFPNSLYAQSGKEILNKGINLYEKGDVTQAIDLVKKSLIQLETESGKKPPAYTNALTVLSIMYREQSKFSLAENSIREALTIFEKTSGKESADYCATINQLGLIYSIKGNSFLAANIFEENLKRLNILKGKENEQYAQALSNLSQEYRQSGDLNRSMETLKESMAITQRISNSKPATNNSQYAHSLQSLGTLYALGGDYVMGEYTMLQAKQIQEDLIKSGVRDNLLVLEFINTIVFLADVYRLTGRYQEAQPVYEACLTLAEKNAGKESTLYQSILNNLSLLQADLHQYEKAEKYLLQSFDIIGRIYGKESIAYAQSLNNLGVFEEDNLNNYKKAESYFLESISISEKIGGKNNLLYLKTLHNLGTVYKYLKNYPKAENYLRQALEAKEKILGTSNPEYINTLNSLASVSELQKKIPEAISLYTKVIEKKLNEIQSNFTILSEEQKKQYLQKNEFYFEDFRIFCLRYYKDYPSLSSQLLDLQLNTKGIIFGAFQRTKVTILGGNNENLKKQFKDWQSLKEKISKANNLSENERHEQGINLQEWTNLSVGMERELSLNSSLFAGKIISKKISWKQIQQQLKVGEAAVEILRTRDIQINKNKVDTVYVAMILTSKSIQPEIVYLKDGSLMEKRNLSFYKNKIKSKQTDALSYNLYWKPIQEKLTALNVKKIYFSGEGAYHQINLNTLQDPLTGKYILETLDIQLLTHLKELTLINKKKPVINFKARLFGRPSYDMAIGDFEKHVRKDNSESREAGTSENLSGIEWQDLEGTEIETKNIALILKSNPKWQVNDFYGQQATEEAVKASDNPQILHIATHGFFFKTIDTTKQNDPMLRSGIVLAGVTNYFQSSHKPATEDGILTASEMANMSLDETQLVVLSACETGIGDVQAGEGVYGLQRALRVAGADAVITSLWKVDDQTTQALMTEFYKGWLSGKTKRTAFKDAQLIIKKQSIYPALWGAFVMVGE